MFNITWIVGILLTIRAILNFDWCYQFTTSFLHLKCVILITMKLIISLFFKNQARKHCIFYITWIVGILLTVGCDIKLWLMLSFHYIVNAPKKGYFDHAEEYYKALWCKNQVSGVVCSILLELSAYSWQFRWY